MTSHEYEAEIGDYVDGTLPHDRVAAIEAHLAACERCRALVADFQTLRSAAGSLERKLPPPHVWTALAAALHAQQRAERRPHGWLWPRMAWRAAMAVVVLGVLAAAGTWTVWRQAAAPARVAAPAPTAPAGGSADATAPANLQQVLTDQIDHLQGIVSAQDAVLPDEMKANFQTTLGAIDSAEGESRAALQTAPTNELAQQSLFEVLRSKLTLLQDMVALINEMRKGNQEGAARIVSGMEK